MYLGGFSISCSKLNSARLFTLFPYISHTILVFDIIRVFKFSFKHTLTPFCLLFIVIKNHTVNMIYIILIELRFNIFMCFSFRTYFIIFLKEDFIHCTIDNIIILLLSGKLFSSCRIMPAVLSRPSFRIIRTKVP